MLVRCLLAAAAVAAVASSAVAQGFPSRPITIIVNAGPGGGTDIFGRLMAEALTRRVGQAVVVENRAGGGGTVGAAAVAQALPDGHTLLFTGLTATAIRPHFHPPVPYKPESDLLPVAPIYAAPTVLAVNAALPVRSFDDFIRHVRERPGQILFATAGVGHEFHLQAELLKLELKLDMVHSPYKGAGPAAVGTAAGEAQMTIASPAVLQPHIQSGRLRPLVALTAERIRGLEDLPTAAESGHPRLAFLALSGIYAPKGTPEAVLDYLNEKITAASYDPDYVARFLGLNVGDPVRMRRADFAKAVAEARAMWGRVIKEANLSLGR